jgi:uncharacterized lipoprotein YbaY
MKPTLLLIAALTSGLALAGCDEGQSTASTAQEGSNASQQSTTEQAQKMTLDGTLSFAEAGQSLPDNAEATVLLNDVALADAPARTIAETTVTIERQAPTDFSLSYASDAVNPRHTHSLRDPQRRRSVGVDQYRSHSGGSRCRRRPAAGVGGAAPGGCRRQCPERQHAEGPGGAAVQR